jgi:hypothetical protein
LLAPRSVAEQEWHIPGRRKRGSDGGICWRSSISLGRSRPKNRRFTPGTTTSDKYGRNQPLDETVLRFAFNAFTK